MDRQAWFNWEAAGSLTANDRIKARLSKILSTHQPPPLPDGAAEAIQVVLDEAEARHRA